VFRARAVAVTEADGDDGDAAPWLSHADPFFLLSDAEESARLPPPTVTLGGANQALHIQWKEPSGGGGAAAHGYELQMRENIGGDPWRTIAASVSGTEVRKKNLPSAHGYQFRVRPVVSGSAQAPFSPPSDPVVALGLSPGIKRLFQTLEKGTLLRSSADPPVPLADALGGKEFVLLYASAHWCGPCRQATPKLAAWYHGLGPGKTIEVVFLSADHDRRSFQDYFSSMPWLAVDFDEEAREELMAFLQVRGIPQLAVLDGRTGRLLEANAIGKPFDLNHWRALASKK
jgi:hypothetical protein